MAHREALIEAIELAGSDIPEAVFFYYVSEGIIKFTAHGGYQFTHGGFLDRDVIKRAESRIDPTPYCHVCGALTPSDCGCPNPFYCDNH